MLHCGHQNVSAFRWVVPSQSFAVPFLGGRKGTGEIPQMDVKPVLNWANVLHEPSWKYSAKLVGSYLGQLFFANLVGSIRRSYIRGPKTFAQHVLGTFALIDDHCL